MPEIRYKRLTRSRARSTFAVAFQSRASLWLGEDHLLCVDANGYAESYKRFYFRDIQAITMRETTRRTVWNAVLVLPVVGSLAGFLTILTNVFQPRNPAAVIVWGLVAALFLVLFLMNNLLGATCACHLRTAVQIEVLPSLCRVRQTRRILAKIRPLIAAAQGGELPADSVGTRMQEWAAAQAGETAANPVPGEPDIPPRLAP